MFESGLLAIFVGATILGLIHGAEPGHGWPIAATYALNRTNKWWSGFVASTLLGIGHLISSLAVVAVFFLAKSYFNLTQINDPVTVLDVQIGGPVSLVAGFLLILLGIREYKHGHNHGHNHNAPEHGPDHKHDAHHHDHTHHNHDHDLRESGTASVSQRIRSALPFTSGHSHDHPSHNEVDERGLYGIVWAAFVLGFAHEEEFEIIGLCMGSDLCLQLMIVYAIAVLIALVGLTMFLIAGYQQYEEQMEQVAEYFPLISAAVLIIMGGGFILGIF